MVVGKGSNEARFCEICGEKLKNGQGIYCSQKCYGKSRRKIEKVERVCNNCGKRFLTRPSGNKLFCSRECHGEWLSKNRRGENSPSWKGGIKIERICKNCGAKFCVRPSTVRQGGGVFCCNTCKNGYRLKHPVRISKEGLERMRIAARTNRKYIEFSTKDTKPERIFIDFYKKFGLENRIKDTRNNSFHIGRLNPDFIICDKKIAIFINGDYWHSALLRPTLGETQQPKFQIAECKRHKWEAVIIWESDLERKDTEQFVLSVLKRARVF